MSRTNKLFVFAIAVLSMVMSAVAALSFANINFGNGAKNQSNQVVENHQNQDDSNDYVDSKHVVKYDYLPIEVENGVLMAYAGEDNAVLKIPSSYSVREDGKLVEGDDYRITKIGENAFKGVKFAYCEVDMTNINEVGTSAFENAKNVHIVNGQNGYYIGDYAFQNAKVVLDQIVLLADSGAKKAVGTQAFTGTQKFDISLAKTLANAGIVWADVIPVDSDAVTITTTARSGVITFGAGTSSAGGNMTAEVIDLENFKGIVNFESYSFGGWKEGYGPYTYHYNEALKTVKLGPGMYDIADHAFWYSTNFGDEDTNSNYKFTMKGTITSLGDYALYNVTNLKNFDFSKISCSSIGEYTFGYCSSLTGNLTIPNNVTEIGGNAFRNCSGLSGSLTIHKNVTFGGSGVFGGCSGFSALNIESGLTDLFYNDATYSSGDGLFVNCSGLKSIVIPSTVQGIGYGCFMRCSGLTSFSIPNSVEKIGSSAFQGCSGLTGSLTIPNSVTSIGSSAFSGCSGLTSITIPDSVTSLGFGCFGGCSGLKKLIIGNGATGAMPSFADAANLEELVIGDKITSITSSYFTGKTKLKKLVIGKGVTSLPSQLLKDCVALTDLTIPYVPQFMISSSSYGCTLFKDYYSSYSSSEKGPFSSIYADQGLFGYRVYSMYNYSPGSGSTYREYYSFIPSTLRKITITGRASTTVGNFAFQYCTILEEVEIGRDVIGLGNNCFNQCSFTKLPTLDYLKTIGDNAFSYNSNLTGNLHIPDSVETLGSSVFRSTGFTSVSGGTNITSQGGSCFYGCVNLKNSFFFPKISTVPSSTFYGCTSITSVTIPERITNVYSECFRGCTGLKTLTLNCTGQSCISLAAFCGCTSLQSVVVGSACTGLGTNMTASSGAGIFSGCTSLSSVTLHNSFKTLGYQAFYNCTSLTTFNIPSSMTGIGGNCFSNSGLSSLTGSTSGWKANGSGSSTTISASSLKSSTYYTK